MVPVRSSGNTLSLVSLIVVLMGFLFLGSIILNIVVYSTITSSISDNILSVCDGADLNADQFLILNAQDNCMESFKTIFFEEDTEATLTNTTLIPYISEDFTLPKVGTYEVIWAIEATCQPLFGRLGYEFDINNVTFVDAADNRFAGAFRTINGFNVVSLNSTVNNIRLQVAFENGIFCTVRNARIKIDPFFS